MLLFLFCRINIAGQPWRLLRLLPIALVVGCWSCSFCLSTTAATPSVCFIQTAAQKRGEAYGLLQQRQQRQKQQHRVRHEQQLLFANNNNNDKDSSLASNSSPSSSSQTKSSLSRPIYNDDAFGLVFLSTLFVENDRLLATVFAISSAVSLLAVRNGLVGNNNNSTNQKLVLVVPGLTAIWSLGLNGLLQQTMPSQLELTVCLLSLLWSVGQAVRYDHDENEQD